MRINLIVKRYKIIFLFKSGWEINYNGENKYVWYGYRQNYIDELTNDLKNSYESWINLDISILDMDEFMKKFDKLSNKTYNYPISPLKINSTKDLTIINPFKDFLELADNLKDRTANHSFITVFIMFF